jgi:hypothetical protein
MGRGRVLGARGLRPGRAGPGRAGLGWARLGRGSKYRGTHNDESEFNSRSKIRNETKQHT